MVAVLAYHLGRLGGGFLGVDVFFVISGFLITRLLLAERERTGTIALGSFWGRRFRRLLPAPFVVLVAVSVAGRAWLPAWRLSGLRSDSLSALAYVANWRFVLSGQSYFSEGVGPSPLRHMWSLAIEEQFYVLWPLVVAALVVVAGRRGRLAVASVAVAGSLASAVWMAVAAGWFDLSRLYYGTDSRAFALLGGAWVATWWDPKVMDVAHRSIRRGRILRLSRLAVPALVALGVLFVVGTDNDQSFYRGGFQAATLLTMVALAGLATGEGLPARVLSTRPLVWLGRRSYGIYLWSWPTQVFAIERFELSGWSLDLAVVTTTLVLAVLSFWLVEEPIRTGIRPWAASRGSRRSRPKVRIVPGALRPVLAVGLVVAVILNTSAGSPPAPDYLTVTDDEAVAAALVPDGFGTTTSVPGQPAPTTTTTAPLPPGAPGPFHPDAPTVVDPGVLVDPATVHGRPLRVLITGDSVGWSLGRDLGPELIDTVLVSNRALIGCGIMPPESLFVVGDDPKPYPETCLRQAEAESLGMADEPDLVLLWLGAWEVYDQILGGERFSHGDERFVTYLEQRIQERVDLYRENGLPTVIPVVPCFGPSGPHQGTERRQAERLDWVNDRLRAVAERNRTWVRMIDPDPVLCEDGEAIETTPEGLVLRADGSHFDSSAATWLWNTWLGPNLGTAFVPPSPGP